MFWARALTKKCLEKIFLHFVCFSNLSVRFFGFFSVFFAFFLRFFFYFFFFYFFLCAVILHFLKSLRISSFSLFFHRWWKCIKIHIVQKCFGQANLETTFCYILHSIYEEFKLPNIFGNFFERKNCIFAYIYACYEAILMYGMFPNIFRYKIIM